mgnify:CR=1 FL=1
MKGQFLKMHNGKEGNNFLRRHKDLAEVKYLNIKKDFEWRVIIKNSGPNKDHLLRHEMKMTSWHRKILAFVVDEANAMLDRYSPRSPRASLDLIKMADDELFKKVGMENHDGFCSGNLQLVVLRGSASFTSTTLADIAFHELMHLFSFQRNVLLGGDGDDWPMIRPERFGLVVYPQSDPEPRYFMCINESITVELTSRFWGSVRSSELFRNDFWRLKEAYGPTKGYCFLVMARNKDGNLEPKRGIAYPVEYGKTKVTIKEMYERNKDNFRSPDEVMDLFIKAYFSGKILPIARLIERTYGKGYFRKIGRISAKIDEL